MNGIDAPLLVGDAPDAGGGDCGCCTGGGLDAPPAIFNRPGLAAIAYRIATHSGFKQAMLARLSAAELPALAGLQTRDGDDFTIALLDAWSVVADVLTFYQERIVNEAYLRTAGERLSVLELAALIGYRARPGVAAGLPLAFTLEEAPGAPEQAVAQTKIAHGTRVQSIPGPDEQAQIFETSEDLDGRVAWNRLKPRMSAPPDQPMTETRLYLAGTATNLKPGDTLLLVGNERLTGSDMNRWDLRRVRTVEPDHTAQRTRVTWEAGLGTYDPAQLPAVQPRIYALRLRAALFGHNAPHPKSLHPAILTNYGMTVPPGDWSFAFAGKTVDLDNSYSSVARKSWLVLAKPTLRALYNADGVAEVSRADYAISGKATRVMLDTELSLDSFDGGDYRQVAVYAQSEELDLAEAPIADPVVGDDVVLDRVVADLPAGRLLMVRGKQAKVKVLVGGMPFFVLSSGSWAALAEDEELVLLAKPVVFWWFAELTLWHVRNADGVVGLALSIAGAIEIVPAGDKDEQFSEIVTLKSVEAEDAEHSRLTFAAPLTRAYDRSSVEILANIVQATHGQTVSEILGSGDARLAHQRFTLKQPPLTYVSAASASGIASTLEVRVGDVLWREVPTLFGRGPLDRVYVTRTADDGKVTVQFGDGRAGARLPSGQDNVRAIYRKGIGRGGLVRAGQVSMLVGAPLGVKSVINPLPAEGAADPEGLDAARMNAPIPVLTLDRAVSLRDYEDFARGFAGVAKALASWSWDGQTRRVFITVAGPEGAEIAADSTLHQNLVAALGGAGDPFVSFAVTSYRPALFRIGLKVKVDPDRLPGDVLPAVEGALRSHFDFDHRAFGQPVAMSEVIAVAQAVPGAVAIDLDRLYRSSAPADPPGLIPRLLAAPPEIGSDGQMTAAELLTLDPAPLDLLEVMP